MADTPASPPPSDQPSEAPAELTGSGTPEPVNVSPFDAPEMETIQANDTPPENRVQLRKPDRG